MFYIKKIVKSLIIFFLSTLFLSFLITLLYHFNIMSNSIYTIFKFITPLFSLFLSSFIFGKQAEKRGWLEGIKIGGIVVLIFLIISSFLLNQDFSIKMMLYYIILLLSSLVGGMVGINRKKD